MVRTYQEVSKRAKNSINIQIGKLVKKYGEKSVRLVSNRFLGKIQEKRLIEQTIKIKEAELAKLKKHD